MREVGTDHVPSPQSVLYGQPQKHVRTARRVYLSVMPTDRKHPVEVRHLVTDWRHGLEPSERILTWARTPKKIGRIGRELVAGVELEYPPVLPHAAHDEVHPVARFGLLG